MFDKILKFFRLREENTLSSPIHAVVEDRSVQNYLQPISENITARESYDRSYLQSQMYGRITTDPRIRQDEVYGIHSEPFGYWQDQMVPSMSKLTLAGKSIEDIQKLESDLQEKTERIQYLEYLLANGDLIK